MADQASLRARVVALILPNTGTDDNDIDAALTAAFIYLDQWSLGSIEESMTRGDGAFDLTGLASWTEGFSRLRSIEYPLAMFPQEYINTTLWRVSASDGLTVSGGGNVTTQAKYMAQNTVATLTDAKAETLALLAAAELMLAWSAKWVQQESVAIAGEDYQGPSSGDAKRLALDLRARARTTTQNVVFLAGTDLA